MKASPPLKGILYIVPTPIGNLKDITLRSLEVLQSVKWIACEDTRRTIKILHTFHIKSHFISYHEHTLYKNKEIIEKLHQGDSVALVSDAGMPLVADSGHELMRDCREEHISVVVLPGPSAVVTALVYSGFLIQNFQYVNFLPRKKSHFFQLLEKLKETGYTVCAFESPHRLLKSLSWMHEFDPSLQVCICREMTKKNEEIVMGSPSYLLSLWQDREVLGEVSIVFRFQ
ncbi:MAG: 16S rRNA (cytidine(1402)-2'-O)-methyltransferase [Caldisericia bacterium]|nr:16S rRNA (cytidine(1402)-2'-O)-methyltransferase [Caldisericia bacterium]MDD4613966.1 16S rRNA (cytidine(1402)-2'-O)-methyltransferase [Caldisericia bacterium]